MNDQIKKLYDNGIQTDMLGQPLEIGDVVLAKGFHSNDKDTFGVVERVNRKTVGLRLYCRYWKYGEYHPRPDGHQGYWNPYPDACWIEEAKYLKRPGVQTLKVSQEFMDTAKARFEAVVAQHPEAIL